MAVDFFPESSAPLPTDDSQRSLKKWNGILFTTYGDHGPACFPEGSRPLPGDSRKRSWEKINAILEAVT